MRELLREILSASIGPTGVLLTIGAVLIFYGSVYLLLYTNLGKRLGFLVVGSATFGWGAINSMLFVLYAPRGPKPANIEGLNAFEIRLIPLTFMLASSILFAMFLLALHRYESGLEGSD